MSGLVGLYATIPMLLKVAVLYYTNYLWMVPELWYKNKRVLYLFLMIVMVVVIGQ